MGFNRLILEGNLTEAPQIRYAQSGTTMASAKIAVNQVFKKQDGSKGEEVLFIKLSFFGRSAEIFSQYCRKGSRVLVEGKLQNNNWEDQNGQKRYDFQMKVENLVMLDSRQDQNQNQGGKQYNEPQYHHENVNMGSTHDAGAGMPPYPPEIDINSDEIPFGYIGLTDKRILHVI